MIKKINTKTIKLIKFYNFINYNLIYNNKAINRYKKDTFEISINKAERLESLKSPADGMALPGLPGLPAWPGLSALPALPILLISPALPV